MTNYYYNQSHIINNCNYTASPVSGDSIEKGRMTVVEKMSK